MTAMTEQSRASLDGTGHHVKQCATRRIAGMVIDLRAVENVTEPAAIGTALARANNSSWHIKDIAIASAKRVM